MNPRKLKMEVTTTALTKKGKTITDMVEGGLAAANLAIQGLSRFVSLGLKPAAMARVYDELGQFASAVDDTRTLIKAKLTEVVQKEGTKTTEKGSMQATLGGWLLEIRPHRTGLDAKKVEGLLRAKNLGPSEYMDTKITYVVNEEKLARAGFTPEEMERCKYDLTWAFQAPKRVE